MKNLVIELMNHGYSQDQAQRFIIECYDAFIDQIYNINAVLESYEMTALERRARNTIFKEVKENHAATDNETVGN